MFTTVTGFNSRYFVLYKAADAQRTQINHEHNRLNPPPPPIKTCESICFTKTVWT